VVGWSGAIIAGGAPGKCALKVQQAGNVTLATVALCEQDHAGYYPSYSNGFLWPVFHYRLDLARFDAGDMGAYRRVKQLFARKRMMQRLPDDIIWIHGYHLILRVGELRVMGGNQLRTATWYTDACRGFTGRARVALATPRRDGMNLAQALRNDVGGRPRGEKLAIGAQKLHARAGHARPQAQHLGPQLKVLTDARAQIVHPQIDRAELGKAVQALLRGFIHVPRANRRHHRQAAHRVQPRADNAAVNAVVGGVAYQFVPHVDARRHAIRPERGDLQAKNLVEDDFFFKNAFQAGDEFFFEFNSGNGVGLQCFGHACLFRAEHALWHSATESETGIKRPKNPVCVFP
jgi:hypothetical protein